MNTRRSFFAMLTALTMFISPGIAAEAPEMLGTTFDGVYFLKNGFQTTILELKDGKYRYWFSSDAKIAEEKTKYPLKGSYGSYGGKVTFVTTNVFDGYLKTLYLPRTNEWTFMRHKGEITLWRPSAIRYWSEQQKLDGYGILRPTNDNPEDIWEKPAMERKPAK